MQREDFYRPEPAPPDPYEAKDTDVPLAVEAPRQQSKKPTRKVKAAGYAGTVVTVGLWLLGLVTGVDMPEEVAAAIVTLITFGAGYVTRPSEKDQIVVPR